MLAAALVGMCSTATVAEARRDAAVLTKPQAAAAVRGVLRANAASCQVRVVRVTVTGSARSWRVAALTSGAAAGSSLWSVVRQPRPLNALARRISRGCPQPPPSSPPPPTSPRPPAPGAPAIYSFGAELSAAQQALVRRGLDAGARYYRSALGRELPSFGIWAPRQSGRDRGRVCADEADLARGCAPALGRRPGWSRDPEKGLARSWLVRRAGGNRAQDRCRTRYSTFSQYELVGERPLGVSTLDEIPQAGPWWLAEGSAEYFAFLAVVEDGASNLARRALGLD